MRVLGAWIVFFDTHAQFLLIQLKTQHRLNTGILKSPKTRVKSGSDCIDMVCPI